MLGRFVITYIDDILIYSPLFPRNVVDVCQVHARLLNHQLYVKAETCVFHHISFLGYIISPEGVRKEEQKVDAETAGPVPKTIKGLQWFLEFANFYRQCICSFSSITAPPPSPPQRKAMETCLE